MAMLSGCGGGDGGSPDPGPSNRPPTFTSAATASVQEGATGTVYTATASDPDGNALSFSLTGGADQARFAITAAGALSFVTPPDFEAPTDADGNNVYLVQIAVSDGTTSATLNLSVTVTDDGTGSAFRVTRVGTGFSSPLALVGIPDSSGRVFIVERAGRIRILNPASGASSQFLDIASQTTTDGERGLLGLALASDFPTSGTFYVYLTNTAGNIEVRRYRTVAGNRDQGDPASGDVLLVIPHPGASNHNGGFIEFGPDGLLYLGTGDGGGANDPDNNAQNRGSLLGKILRIDIAGDAFPADPQRDYRIPAGNPFAGGGGAAEIWAYGLRNPFRASFDPLTQNLWIGDVGQGAREEVDLMRPTDGGANFGWDVVEGTLGTPQAGFVPPVAEYGHGNGPTQGNSITGGRVYRGPIEALRGQYIFGDFISGNLWSFPIAQAAIGQTIPASQFTLRNTDFAPNAGTIDNPAGFGVDQTGNLYIVDFDGEIFRIEPA
ncbi:PQQ-dependent sugar dehydrogenase [Sphingosinicella sp. LHD-64]|uniref:PQQ-dependent sugar dehydrogenase n=1 Tax=Sphingosinicella sp. LHD-64 TaxID=3072139 RepID=UPI00280C9088|nr:PQQ-dependent sugar dehydrogenase [Sphingosinicella sp. LHD-64]MDQ8758009.1 PQQ-dependent sugar dehydrogenase [Sphingosinicella sp. LHD-64]